MVGSSQRARRPGLRTRVNGTIAIARDAIPWAIRFGGSHGRGHVVVLGEVAAGCASGAFFADRGPARSVACGASAAGRSEEHTSELQSLMRISYAVFCLKKKK